MTSLHFVLERPRKRPLRTVIGGDPMATEPEQAAELRSDDSESGEAVQLDAAPAAVNSEPEKDSARDTGFQQGYQEGLQEGRRKGLEQGRTQGRELGEQAMRAQLEQQRAQLEAVLQALDAPLTTLKSDLAEAVAAGGLSLARFLVRGVLEADPQALTAVVSDIVDEAAQAGGPQHVLRIQVPPDGYDAVSAIADTHGAEVIVDQQLQPGDVSATLVKNNGDPVHQIEWDARLETRWQAIRAALGLRPI